MTKKSELGQLGEKLACDYLKKRGYKIIERNYWKPFGELDVVALSPDKILVFIEVKTVNGPAPAISSEEQLTYSKRKKLEKISFFYANGSGAKFLSDKGWRVDLVAVTKDGDSATIKHYENI